MHILKVSLLNLNTIEILNLITIVYIVHKYICYLLKQTHLIFNVYVFIIYYAV